MRQFTVNKRFRDLIPPLSNEEREQLERNILADGCRDPIVIWDGTIVDGHNRYEICQKHGLGFRTEPIVFDSEDDACIWIIQNQFGRRNLAIYTIGELTLKLEPLIAAKAKANQQVSKGRGKKGSQNSVNLKPIDTQKELAKLSGLSHDTIAKIKLIDKHADEDTKQRLRNKEIAIHRVAKEIKETKQREERKEKRTAAAKTKTLDKRIIVGDFRDHFDKVADGSVSLIFTDPPYDKKAAELYAELGAFAKEKLADGGSLICYVGHVQLIEALNALSTHVRFWWPLACVHSGRTVLMREYGIKAHWKPVLWFVKGTRDDKTKIVADVMSGGTEKTHHDWQQSQSEAECWIDALTAPGDLVCDPFLGGGTTAAAAQKLSREWLGFEIDAYNARICSQRIEESANG